MGLREFLGMSKILSEREFLNMEIDKVNKTKNKILIAGYDNKIIENPDYLSALKKAVERGVKVNVILHEGDPPTKLEKFLENIEMLKSDKAHLVYHGFRAYDKHFGVSYNKNKKSQYAQEKDMSYRRNYIDNANNIFLRILFCAELGHIFKKGGF